MTEAVERLRVFLENGEWDQLKIRDAILETELSGACKLTLSAIVRHHSAKNPSPVVGLRRLARLATARPNTVTNAISELERLGIVGVSRRNRATNVYDLSGTMAALLTVAPFGTVTPSRKRRTVSNEATATVAPIDTDGRAPRSDLSQTEHPICLNRGSDLSQTGTRKEPGRNQMKEPDPASHSSAQQSLIKETPDQTPPPKPEKQRSGSETSKSIEGTDPPDPRVTQLRDHYSAEYERAKRVPPKLGKQWPRAMRALKDLLSELGDLDAAKRVITRNFADDWRRTNRCQPWEIVADLNKLQGDQPSPRKANGAQAPQHSGVDVGAKYGRRIR